MSLALKANPLRHTFGKAGVPNFDPIFGSGYPYSWFDGGSPFSAMRTKPGINHPWVYSAITTIIEAWVQCPWVLVDKNDPKKEFITDHDILRLLKRPNPDMSGTNFREAMMWYLLLPTRQGPGGQAFVWGDEANFRKGEIPDELWVQGDHGVKPILNDQKILRGWALDYQEGYSPYDYGRGMTLDLQEVIRINFFNPYNAKQGASPGFPLRAGISQDASAQQHNTSLIESGGTPKGMLTLKKSLTPAQQDDLRKNWDKYVSGPSNAGKDAIVPFEADYVSRQLSPEDMQYMEQLGWNRESIGAAYKVSKFAMQLYEDLNYATAKEAKRQLFEQSIIPKSSVIIQELNDSWICNIGKGNLLLAVDYSKVAALRDDMDARVKRAQMLVEMGFPPIIACKMCEIPLDEVPAGKFPWLMENQSPNAAFQSNGPAEEDPKKIAKSLKKKDLTREEKHAISDDYIAKVLDPGEKMLLPAVRRFFIQQRNRNLDLIDAWEAKGHTIVSAQPHEFILDKGAEDTKLRVMMKPHYEKQAEASHRRARLDIARVRKAPLTVDSTQGQIQTFILQRLKYISVVNNTTFAGIEKDVADSLADSISNELSVKDTAKALKDSVNNGYQGRMNEALNIARTETGTVSMFIQATTMKNAGIERKRWISARDEATRETHLDADAEGVIGFDEVFGNGLAYPLESGAPASEVCNCRCFLAPVAAEGEE